MRGLTMVRSGHSFKACPEDIAERTPYARAS
ncbi:hypothetical protein PS647_06302 [Pseudomonas fluorescens]|nr:hypothetical protein PS647_06302 [Pseudomonas fluorescens]